MPSARGDRPLDRIRDVEIVASFQRTADGSVLYRAGGTAVLCSVSIDPGVPRWLEGKGQGWMTAEYQMHPRASPARREARDGRDRPLSGRSREIQRLIGRALRAAVDLEALGERTLTLDCDVLEADGGTRTASVTGGWLALALAIERLARRNAFPRNPLVAQVAAVSVGLVDGARALDLCYAEDSAAQVDLNVVGTAAGGVVEVQGTAEGRPIERADFDALLDLGLTGVGALAEVQRQALAAAGFPEARLPHG